MEQAELAALLFPKTGKTLADYETVYPPRRLPPGAPVTRLAPSPTGFIHLGNVYGALASERLAHQNGGLFLLRIEDTDEKREKPGAVEALIEALAYFGLRFDEGAAAAGERGAYGPYRQRERVGLYHAAARALTERGLAYPCFCSEEELQEIRAAQAAAGANFGYYGAWAKYRDLPPAEARRRLERGEPFVLRWRAPEAAAAATVTVTDAVRGALVLPANEQDIVLLKSNGVPTYHFAHVVDDHFMRVTHAVRGEEWLPSLPVHAQLFAALAWEPPVYCHTPLLLKMEGGGKRKLSKRKDPELALDFYRREGYHPLAVREYLMTILNSGYEEWRLAHPGTDMEEFSFSLAKIGASGALFDLQKLNDISKNVFAALAPEETADFLRQWAEAMSVSALLKAPREYLTAIAAIGRREANPRKDFIYGAQIFSFISFFFDECFQAEDPLPDNMTGAEAGRILTEYLAAYDHAAGKDGWFAALKRLAVAGGYAEKPKDYKKQPELYKGHIGDVSAVIRLALSGRKNSPDLWEIQQAMGEQRVRGRLAAARQRYGGPG
ncbi:MAG: glutamate--tRNA ligase [Gracilibacteraceae bacterium]|jgi:glutamyl-tRNA synthetase|nr:glutamate--tRNA ligase [Gracilibacteraceae bacterium]